MARVARILTVRRAVAAVLMFLVGSAVFVDAQQPRRNVSWVDNGGSPENTHFVNSTQITKENVGQLQVAWSLPVADGTGSLFNPIVVDDTMYALGRGSALVSLNAVTGKVNWVHEGLTGIARRGINYWESKDRRERRLLFQINHTLQAIDAQTGSSILTFGTNGFVDLRANLRRDPQDIYRIQSNNPGRVFENLLILGSVTGEGYMSPPGDIRAFDVRTGKVAWQFHTVPHPGEYGYETWPKDAWQYVGGVNNWGEMAVDSRRGIVYIPTGSGTYDFYGADRHGVDLFANCLLALDARTGKRLWHQQLVHHDLWDYDLVSAPQLITVRRNGRNIDAVAQSTKQGFLFVFNRVTGAPIFPIDEKPAPASEVPGEEASTSQPVPRLPPYAKQSFTADDINPYLPDDEKAFWTNLVKSSANKGLFTPSALDRDTIQMPGNRGGSNWGTTSSNPSKGLVYVQSINAPAILQLNLNLPGAPPAPPNAAGGRGGRGAAASPSPGEAVYQRTCQACHGANRQGGGTIPNLNGVVDRLGAEGVTNVIENGRGQMPAFGLADSDLAALLGYLANPAGAPAGGGRGRGAGPGATAVAATPIGPVAGTGGAPAAADFVKTMPQGIPAEFGAHGGPAYPAGLLTPTIRYYTGWNVMRNIIAPPWSLLTAYDLNKGTIAWQIPIGEEPRMVAMGVRNTGIQQEQRAVVVTPTGLLFASTSDGYLRALDADTGKQLWAGRLPAQGAGIPAMYEIDGRAFIVVPTGGTPFADTPADPSAAPGYVAFALPRSN